jgi:cytochrome P450
VRPLPPGPRSALVESARYARDPYGHLARLAARFGDVFTLPLVTGPVVILGHPDGARAVFTAEPETFGIWARDQIVPVFGAGSIFVATGEAHRRQRRAVVAALAELEPPLELVRARAAALGAGQVVDVTRWALDLSFEAIVGALFGAAGPGLAAACAEFVARANDPWLLLPLLLKLPPFRTFARARADLVGRLDPLIAQGRVTLGDLDAAETRDNLLTLLIAGHETTAHAVAWALHELAHAPRALEPARTDPAYLDAVCEETLRLHPVVVQVTRQLERPLGVGPCTVPAGAAVSPSACLIHRRAQSFADPHAFRPERFLERTYTPFEDLPFGGGPSRCPGAAFGKAQMKAILAALLDRFTPVPTYGEARAVVRGLVMVPDRPLTMRLAPR